MHNNLNLSVATVLAPAIGPSPLRTPPNGRPNNAKLGSSCTTCATLHSAQQELASRRAALRAVLAGIGQVAVTAVAGPALARDARQGEVSHTEAEWQQLLSPDAYAVLRQASTERRNSSPLVQEHRVGVFSCAGCGADLFPSSAKFESGTGWPSFFDVLPGGVDLTSDTSIPFMARTEVRCHTCQGHLGHVFNDGPPPTGLRYCMNGAALSFRPSPAAA